MLQINVDAGSVQLFIDPDQNPGTGTVSLATIATIDPLAIGTTVIVDTA